MSLRPGTLSVRYDTGSRATRGGQRTKGLCERSATNVVDLAPRTCSPLLGPLYDISLLPLKRANQVLAA